MTFTKWLSLTEAEREAEKRGWYPFEPGYWHSIASEAAARFSAEFGSKPHVTKVFKSLHRARELIVAVQTDLAPKKRLELPQSYLGFKVVQFANRTPEGILVDPAPPGKFSRRTTTARPRSGSRVSRPPVGKPRSGSRHVLTLEGEIDLHTSPKLATQLRSLTKDKPEKLVVDLSKVPYIDSSGLAVLIHAMQKVEAYRGKLYLVGLQEPVRIVFETSRLEQVFRIRRDVESTEVES